MTPDSLPTEQIGLFDAMNTMRAIREFKPDPILDATLKQVLAAAGQAPSGGNRQPWKFIVIRSAEGKAKIAELIGTMQQRAGEARAASGRPDATPSGTAAPAPDFPGLVRSAPALVIVCAIAPAAEGPQTVGPFGQTFPAVENLLLAARGLGLGGNITTGFRAMEKEFKEYLNIPDNLMPTCLVPLGYPTGVGRNKHGKKSRLPVEETTFAEKYGVPITFSA
jgi:nitroreductase